MTGFGKITIENGNRKVVIEIKSLNSKTLDLNLKMPNLYKEKEMEIRNIVKEQLDRGKVEMCIYFDNTESDKDVTINKPVVTQYFNQLLDIANELGIEADKNKILKPSCVSPIPCKSNRKSWKIPNGRLWKLE